MTPDATIQSSNLNQPSSVTQKGIQGRDKLDTSSCGGRAYKVLTSTKGYLILGTVDLCAYLGFVILKPEIFSPLLAQGACLFGAGVCFSAAIVEAYEKIE